MNKEWIPDILNAVYEASEAIMEVYRQDFEVMTKSDHTPVTVADQQSNEILVKALEKTGILIVSEEGNIPDYKERKDHPIWLVDPLDGTKEFIRKSGEFCICIALIENNEAVFGMIASPVQQEVIFGGKSISPAQIRYGEEDIFNTQHQLKSIADTDINTIIYSRTHYTPRIDVLVAQLEENHGQIDRTLCGSAMKFFELVNDSAQIYPRLWPTMEWDIAAGDAIYGALGGEVVEFTTFAPLRYNKESLYNPKFIAKPKGLKLN